MADSTSSPPASRCGQLTVEELLDKLNRVEREYAVCQKRLAEQQEALIELSLKLNEEFVMLYSLLEFNKSINSSLDKSTLLHGAIELLERIFGLAAVAFFEWRQEEAAFVLIGSSLLSLQAAGQLCVARDESFLQLALQSGQACRIDDLATSGGEFSRRYLSDMRAALCAPLLSRGGLRGVLAAFSADPAGFTDRQFLVISAIAAHLAIAIENADLHYQLKEQAATDDLTGLINRRVLNIHLVNALAHASCHRLPLSLLMIDVDHFKQYNDTYGHCNGDSALHLIGQLLSKTVRAGDICARYGGEEFVVILPDTDADYAWAAASRIRQAVEDLWAGPQSASLKAKVTVSIGIATIHHSGDVDAGSLLRLADSAMYRAKQLGRNRVCVA